MSSAHLRETPRRLTDLLVQAAGIVEGRSIWILLILLSVPLLVSGGFAYWGMDTVPASELAYYFLALAAVLWPIGVWRNDAWGKRDYRWSLPVSTVAHDITRVLVGWLYLAGGTVLLMAGAVYFDHRGGAISGAFFLDRPIFWIGSFTYPATLYLLVSAFALSTKSPGKYLFYCMISPSLVVGLLSVLGFPQSIIRMIGGIWEATFHPLAIQISSPVQSAASSNWGWATGICLLSGSLSVLIALLRYERTAR